MCLQASQQHAVDSANATALSSANPNACMEACQTDFGAALNQQLRLTVIVEFESELVQSISDETKQS